MNMLLLSKKTLSSDSITFCGRFPTKSWWLSGKREGGPPPPPPPSLLLLCASTSPSSLLALRRSLSLLSLDLQGQWWNYKYQNLSILFLWKKYQTHCCMFKDRYELNYMTIKYQVMYVFVFHCNTKQRYQS